MLEHNSKHQVFFHKHFAWNLVETAYRDGMCKRNEHWKKYRKLGIREDWLTPENEARALQMFVLFDQILLPGELDIPLQSTSLWKDKHVDWVGSIHPGLVFSEPPWKVDEVADLQAFIKRALSERGYDIDDQKYENVIDIWKAEILLRNGNWLSEKPYAASPDLEAMLLSELAQQDEQQGNHERAIMVRQRVQELNVFLERQKKYAKLSSLISDEANSLHTSLFLADKGVPTFGYGAKLPPVRLTDQQKASKDDEHIAVILKIYFENIVRCPAPKTLKEALNLRENLSVHKWRQQVLSWSQKLAAGNTSYREIKTEIEEANSYIQGAYALSEIIPSWSVFITFPLGVAMLFVPGLQPAGSLLLALDGINFYGQIVKQVVTSPNRSQYPWLMIARE